MTSYRYSCHSLALQRLERSAQIMDLLRGFKLNRYFSSIKLRAVMRKDGDVKVPKSLGALNEGTWKYNHIYKAPVCRNESRVSNPKSQKKSRTRSLRHTAILRSHRRRHQRHLAEESKAHLEDQVWERRVTFHGLHKVIGTAERDVQRTTPGARNTTKFVVSYITTVWNVYIFTLNFFNI